MGSEKCGLVFNTRPAVGAGAEGAAEPLGEAQHRSRSYVAAEAIREYVNVSEWQTEEIRKALTEAERGEFAGDEQVRSVMKKRTAHKGTHPARYAPYVSR